MVASDWSKDDGSTPDGYPLAWLVLREGEESDLERGGKEEEGEDRARTTE